MNTRHITRFTYKFTNFQGWRVAITRQGVALARYFSDKQYGDEEAAYTQAIRFRDMVLAELEAHPEQTQTILMKHRVQPQKMYPAGLKPSNPSNRNEGSSTACSMRSNKVLHSVLRKVCHRLKLDTASVLKLSLYLFTLQYGSAPTMAAPLCKTQQHYAAGSLAEDNEPEMNLQELIAELETRARQAGLPSFEEFATGNSPTAAATLAEQHSAPPGNANRAPLPPPEDEDAFPDNYHAAARYMRSSRPSPPPAMTTSHHPTHSTTPHTHISRHLPHTRDYSSLSTLVTADDTLPLSNKRQTQKSERCIPISSEHI